MSIPILKPAQAVALPILAALIVLCVGPALSEANEAPHGVQLGNASLELDDVFAALDKMKGFEAAFDEQKHLALLQAPLESSGRLYYLSPGQLVRDVKKPEQMRITVSKGRVRMKDAEGTRTIDLRSRPGIAAFVQAFGHLLDGNRAALERHFQLKYRAADEKWTLHMSPRSGPLQKVIRSVTISGKKLVVETMSIVETNGDRTVTSLTEVNVHRTFSAAEKKQLFGP